MKNNNLDLQPVTNSLVLKNSGSSENQFDNNNIIIYNIYRALIPNGPKALYIIKITKS